MNKKMRILFKIIVFIIILFGISRTEKTSKFFYDKINKLGQYTSIQTQEIILTADDLIKNSKNESDMNENTKYLQKMIDEASSAGGGIVNIPAGTYYFSPADEKNAFGDNRVIKCKNNVTIQGTRK